MEARFRPIQLSLIDFFGVLIPGFVWLVLLATFVQMFASSKTATTPMTAWRDVAQTVEASGTWIGPLGLIFVSVLIGNVVKPQAMTLATWIALPLLKRDRRFKGAAHSACQHPYTPLHEGQEHYRKVCAIIADITGCDAATLPGKQPFDAAKRILHLSSPALWEESEHMEAETRLVGTMLVAASVSVALASVQMLRSVWQYEYPADVVLWLVLSVVAWLASAWDFNKQRTREVEYTYANLIIGLGCHEKGVVAPISTRVEADDT